MLNNDNSKKLEGKTILLVNSGSQKKRFILQRIKKLGLNVVLLHKEKNWAQSYVDHWILADTANHSEAIAQVGQFIKDNPQIRLDGVITFWEDDVLLTAKIADKFNFVGIPYNVAKVVRNKYALREFCRDKKLPVVGHKLVKNEADLKTVVEQMTFPLVIKPAYGAGSAFVMRINNSDELRDSFNYIKKNLTTQVESALTDGTDIFVEEYIDGDEVDIDILLQNGRLKFAAVSDNSKTAEPFFVENDRSTPSNLPANIQDGLIRMADEILEQLGVQNGCIHFEAKSTSRGPMPLEINLRMGGDEIYSSIKTVWRVDLIECALQIALGLYFSKIDVPVNPYKYIVARTCSSEDSGVLVNLDIDPEIIKKDFVEEVAISKKIGDEILVPPSGYEYLGWVMVSGESAPDAEDNLTELMRGIEYRVAKFHHASSIGKTERKNGFSPTFFKKDFSLVGRKIEKLRLLPKEEQRNLHIGIAYNDLIDDGKSGEWSEVESELTNVGKIIGKTLQERGYRVSFFDFNDVGKVFNDLKSSDVDLVFNLCERINDSSLLEPHAVSIFDALQIPYTGSNPFTLGLCIDKIRVKKLLSYHAIPTANWDYIYDLNDKLRPDLRYPLIVKPANTDNSIGITNDSVVTNREGLERQLKYIIEEIKRPALIEEYIEGDEYDVSILGSEEDDLHVLPLSRDSFVNLPNDLWHIWSFEAKWGGADNVYVKNIVTERPPKNMNKKLEALLSEIALDTYNILDCHDYGRVDIRVDKNNNPYVLELNPNPSINIGNCVPTVAAVAGLNYGDFLEEIIRLCIKRYKDRPPYFHLQSNMI